MIVWTHNRICRRNLSSNRLYVCPKDFPFATPESADLWNRATRLDLFLLVNVYRCLNYAQEILTDRCVLDFVIVSQAFKVSDSCTLAWQRNDRENAFVFPQLPLIRFHGRTIATNEFLLGIVFECMYIWSSHTARVRINRVRLTTLLVVS